MIDAGTENLVGLTEAALDRRLRRNGRPVHVCTVWRWAEAGRLETIRVGGRTFTSTEAISRMLAAQNGVTVAQLSPAKRARELDALEERLASAGI